MIIFARKKEAIFIILLLIIGGFLRLYRFRQTMQFFGDQGRDAIIAKQILIDHNLTLIGPVTSVGNMYLGPFYYYFMVPWLALTYPNPIGPAIAVAIISILTIPLLYFITKKILDQPSAIIASIFYTFSSTVTASARFSWNPNLAPLFGLLIIYSLYYLLVKKKTVGVFWTLLFFGILIQLHYLTVLIFPTIILNVFLSFKQSQNRIQIIKHTLFGMLVFFILSLPLILFDIRHDLINYQALKEFLTSPQEHIRPTNKIISTIIEFQGKAYRVLAQLIVKPKDLTDRLLTLISIVGSIWLLVTTKVKAQKQSLLIIIALITFSIIGLSFYTSPIFDHYLGFLYPAVFILLGSILAKIWKLNLFSKALVVSFSLWLIFVQLEKTPALSSVGVNVTDIQQTADLIVHNAEGLSRYNLTLFSHTRDFKALNYRYFLETTSHPPQSPDDYGKLDALYIISEPPHADDPFTSDAFEIQYPNLKTIDTIFFGPKNIKVYKAIR